jgi:hypothetical protein
MRSSPNLVSRRSYTSTSSSSKEKHPSTTKPQGQPTTTTISAATLSKYTSLTLTTNQARGLSTTNQISITREGACQAESAVTVEARTHSKLYNVCTMVMTPTITQKIAPSSSNPKERWSRTPSSPHNNHCLEK